MVKKIIISYLANPATGDSISYGFTLNGNPIFINSFSVVNVNYLNTPQNSHPFGIGLYPTMSDTIDNTVSFLKSIYYTDGLSYKRVNDTIEILMNIEGVEVVSQAVTGSAMTITVEDVEEIDVNVNLKYYFEYQNLNGDHFLGKIFEKGYEGSAIETNGKATLIKGQAKNHTDPIRGTGLDIELTATVDVTLSDLYTNDEQAFSVKFYKNNKLVFVGFLKPDGVFESFVRDIWVINLTCVDGLGFLENLSFVDYDGKHLKGKMLVSEIIFRCLKRTGLEMKYNTSVNLYYEGLTVTPTTDIFGNIYLNANRFIKIDDDTIMSCEEVLKSVLDLFSACITQINGEWYIYRNSEIYLNSYIEFKKYSETGAFIKLFTFNANSVLGSHIDNFYPHHSEGNQQKQIKGAINSFRINYKYGKVLGFLQNNDFFWDGNYVNPQPFDNWTLNLPYAQDKIQLDPVNPYGLKSKLLTGTQTIVKLATSDPVTLAADFTYTLRCKYRITDFVRGFRIRFVVKCGALWLTSSGEWATTSQNIDFRITTYEQNDEGIYQNTYEFKVDSQPLPSAGSCTIEVHQVRYESDYGFPIYGIHELVDIAQSSSSVYQGEFHTVARKVKVSSIVKSNKTIYNGDRRDVEYYGDIFKADQITPTTKWNRKGFIEQKPILLIAAEDELRLSAKPLVIFSGSVYGELPYLALCSINNVEGKFMPIEWEYDSFRNTTKIKFLELIYEELNDIEADFKYDLGNVVRPTIV